MHLNMAVESRLTFDDDVSASSASTLKTIDLHFEDSDTDLVSLQKNKIQWMTTKIQPLSYYRMESKSKGQFIIFNNENFIHDKDRLGTKRDKSSLTRVSKLFGFTKTSVYPDYTTNQVKQQLKIYSSEDFTNEDCLVCAILSHGDSNGFISTYDGKINIQVFFDAFSDKACPSLKGKPKIFIVQACRGNIKESYCDTLINNGFWDRLNVNHGYKLPEDFIVAFSTVPGYLSWRNKKSGSYFIQSFCEVASKNPNENFINMLTKTNNELIRKLHKRTGEKKAQTACFQTTLTKLLNFNIEKSSEKNI